MLRPAASLCPWGGAWSEAGGSRAENHCERAAARRCPRATLDEGTAEFGARAKVGHTPPRRRRRQCPRAARSPARCRPGRHDLARMRALGEPNSDEITVATGPKTRGLDRVSLDACRAVNWSQCGVCVFVSVSGEAFFKASGWACELGGRAANRR